MGPSGAGKSSFLDVVCKRAVSPTGEVSLSSVEELESCLQLPSRACRESFGKFSDADTDLPLVPDPLKRFASLQHTRDVQLCRARRRSHWSAHRSRDCRFRRSSFVSLTLIELSLAPLISVPFILYSLPPNTPGIEEHIDRTLVALGLQDVADNHIGTPLSRGISGGQKRRVTIACSMVARPRVLVLDEPTSGLDAASSREVISSRESFGHLQSFLSTL